MVQCAKENQQEWKWKLSWSTASKGKSSIPLQPSALGLLVIYAGFFFLYLPNSEEQQPPPSWAV